MYFQNKIAVEGERLYRKGKVGELTLTMNKYSAIVEDDSVYFVQAWKKSNGQLGMSCECDAAINGEKCKHMAAVYAKIEAQYRNGWDEIERQEAVVKNVEVYPFKVRNEHSSNEYTYFDLSLMTNEIKIMQKQLEDAQRLIKNNKVELYSISEGYTRGFYGDAIPAGEIKGCCSLNDSQYIVSLSYTAQELQEAQCNVEGCYHKYYKYCYGVKKICKHQLATLLLFDDYIDKHNPGDVTDYRFFNMFESYCQYHRNQIVDNEVKKDDLLIEPKLILDDEGLSATFKVGVQKLYVIKNLREFVDNVENNEVQQFGSKSEINYRNYVFNKNSLMYYNFIKKIIKDEEIRATLSTYYEYAGGSNDICLYGSKLDEFYEIIKECGTDIEYHNKILGKKGGSLSVTEGLPKMKLNIDGDYVNNIFRGIRLKGEIPELIEGESFFYVIENNKLIRIEHDKMNVIMPLIDLAVNGKINCLVGRKALINFYYHVLPVIDEYIDVKDNIGEEIRQYLAPEARFKFYLDEEDGELFCATKAFYGEKEYNIVDNMYSDYSLMTGRDEFSEREVLDKILEYCPTVYEEQQVFSCKGDDDICRMLEDGIKALMTYGEVLCTDRVKNIHIHNHVSITVGVSLESGLMELEIRTDDLSPKELLELFSSYRKKKKYHRLSNGSFINTENESLDNVVNMLDSMQISDKEILKGNIHLPAYRALYLDKMLEKNDHLYVERDKHFKKLIKEFKALEDSDFEVPVSLRKIMRPYQITGFKWLKTLEAYGFGGIMADDMGLGKTLQVISVLLYAKEEQKSGCSIVIAPASLIYNWYEEIQKFAPKLNAKVISGGQAERYRIIAECETYDVVITSYDLLKRDIAEYENKKFIYQIIDEAQYIKNHSTAVAKAVKCIQSVTKYALTGTPIENRLSELWSIFDYLMPGFLYAYEAFRKDIERPVIKNKDERAALRLKRMVAPFILRRLKQDVLKDLPDKLEEVQYTMFEEKQQHIYDAQVMRMKALISEQSEDEFSRNKMQILAELTRLREICCDPGILFENYDGESAKRNMCIDLIKRAMEGGHRMLVFSQFTSMLELLEGDLINNGISYYKITGSTKKEDRVHLVKQFNEGDVPVFLISLKAGGTGLNLIGADTVIHYDPWWNYAAQNQGTDRAHRIGQKKVVTVYKLIAKGSIEEKILKMQELKKNLADEILSGASGELAGMTKEELIELLEK